MDKRLMTVYISAARSVQIVVGRYIYPATCRIVIDSASKGIYAIGLPCLARCAFSFLRCPLTYTIADGAESLLESTADTSCQRTPDGTLYWTLSLYIDAATIKDFLPQTEKSEKITHLFRKAQLQHYPSFALR